MNDRHKNQSSSINHSVTITASNSYFPLTLLVTQPIGNNSANQGRQTSLINWLTNVAASSWRPQWNCKLHLASILTFMLILFGGSPGYLGSQIPLLPAPNSPHGRVNGPLAVLQCYYMWPSAVFVAVARLVVVLSLLFSVYFVFLLFVNDRTGDPNSRGSKFFLTHTRGIWNAGRLRTAQTQSEARQLHRT